MLVGYFPQCSGEVLPRYTFLIMSLCIADLLDLCIWSRFTDTLRHSREYTSWLFPSMLWSCTCSCHCVWQICVYEVGSLTPSDTHGGILVGYLPQCSGEVHPRYKFLFMSLCIADLCVWSRFTGIFFYQITSHLSIIWQWGFTNTSFLISRKTQNSLFN